MYRKLQRGLIVLAAVCAIAVGSAVIANAASSGSGNSTNAASGTSAVAQQAAQSRSGGPAPGEEALTGDTAEKVKAAALDEVPGGTVLRVETDSDGSPYEAHVRKSDGAEVEVKVDKSFNVTDVEEFGGRHP